MHTTEYLKELEQLHSKKTFGLGKKIPKRVNQLITSELINSMLDFGCGKGMSFSTLSSDKFKVFNYDPITSPIELPNIVDLVYSSDVLEHIEPTLLNATLDQLFSIGQKYQYHLIACHPAKKTLSDGRNAHLIIENPDWWKVKMIDPRWKIIHEEILEFEVQPKKGPLLHIKKYIVFMEKV